MAPLAHAAVVWHALFAPPQQHAASHFIVCKACDGMTLTAAALHTARHVPIACPPHQAWWSFFPVAARLVY